MKEIINQYLESTSNKPIYSDLKHDVILIKYLWKSNQMKCKKDLMNLGIPKSIITSTTNKDFSTLCINLNNSNIIRH
jgi:hypothetical protein